MSQTQDALILAALQEVGAVGAGQAASAEDVADTLVKIGPMVEDLSAKNCVYVPDTDDIDDAVYNHLVRILAELIAPKFGRPSDLSVIAFAEDQLRLFTRIGRGTGQKLKTERMLRLGIRPLYTRTL